MKTRVSIKYFIEWLLNYSYNPYKGSTKQHVSNMSKGAVELKSKYDIILTIDDLISERSEHL